MGLAAGLISPCLSYRLAHGQQTRAMTTLGFRVKSGYAIAIALKGPARAPIAAARFIVELSDPRAAETRQPYHSGFGEAETDQRVIARRIKLIERTAARSIEALLSGVSACRAGIVVGSVIDPATVSNPHIRAHANEGRLFRVILEDALTERGVRCSVEVEKSLGASARACLACTGPQIERMMTAFGRTLGRPWRSEEKAAAVAAWMALHSRG